MIIRVGFIKRNPPEIVNRIANIDECNGIVMNMLKSHELIVKLIVALRMHDMRW